MSIGDKIKKIWWVIISFIPFLNGLGFVYIGFKHSNRNWVIEGITYEFPWFFYFIMFAIYPNSPQATAMVGISISLMLVSIIRSIWVAVKLIDVYENHEKYTIKQTNLRQKPGSQTNENNSAFSCCMCIACIFIIFAVIMIL